jgi:hypothetical protein
MKKGFYEEGGFGMLKVGQKVFVKPFKGGLENVKEYEVERIGSKYFYLKGCAIGKFSIDEMWDISKYSPEFKAYLSIQEIGDEIEKDILERNLRGLFGYYPKPKFTLDQLRRIYAIVSE